MLDRLIDYPTYIDTHKGVCCHIIHTVAIVLFSLCSQRGQTQGLAVE